MKYSLIIFLFCFFPMASAQNIPLYVGTYTDSDSGSKGIYLYDFNLKTGELTNKKLAVEAINPSYIAFSSDKKLLYSVGETDNFEGEKSGSVNAYSVSKSGTLTFINKVSSNGAHPCHVQLNEDNSKVAVSNYTGGTVSIHNIKKTGEIASSKQVINHNTPTIQSHAHSAKFFNNALFVADLGRDYLAQYVESGSNYLLKENYSMEPNAGPRHFEISKKGKFIYVINELNSTISVLKKKKDSYVFIQNMSTLDPGFNGKNFCADIHLSKDGLFLYGSNRGENSIAVFKINKRSGKLQKTQTISTNGDWPRNFTLSPDGNYLLAANQRSKNISVYSVDEKTGNLIYLHCVASPTPSCLLF